MMLSVIPSLRYSASGSRLPLTKGRTAIELTGFPRERTQAIPPIASAATVTAAIRRRRRFLPGLTAEAALPAGAIALMSERLSSPKARSRADWKAFVRASSPGSGAGRDRGPARHSDLSPRGPAGPSSGSRSSCRPRNRRRKRAVPRASRRGSRRRKRCPNAGRPASAHLLGRHVAERAEHHAWLACSPVVVGRSEAGPRLCRGIELGQAEIQDLHPPVLRHEDVLGLQVAMDDPLLVRRCQPVRDLQRVVRAPCVAGRVRAGEAAPQRLAFEQLLDDVGSAVAFAVPMS